MAHELVLMKDGKRKNITQLVGGLTWSSNMDALGIELSFEYAFNDTLFFAKHDIIKLGDQIALFNGVKYLGRFVVVDEAVNGRFGKTYTCFDFAWYLNKNETVIQFNKASATQAIKKLLDRFGIKHSVPAMNTLITHIYKGETVSDILADILDQVKQETGITYRAEMDKDTLKIVKTADFVIKPMVRFAPKMPLVPAAQTIGNPSTTRSIQELKNSVVVVKSGEDSASILATLKDTSGNIGTLTKVVEVEDKNEAQARNIARNTLAEVNRIEESISVDLLGHDDIRAGRIMYLEESVTGLKGNYLIKSASHTASGGIHTVSVELEAV